MAELPDDLSAWPSDPYALLGVSPGAAARDIRKAYTNLIRRFKPERFPDHFRRIREAYDQVDQREKWRAYDPPPPTPEPTPEPISEPAPPEPPPVERLPVPRRDEAIPVINLPPWRPENDAPGDIERENLWDLACAGEHQRVYRQLRQRVERGGADEIVYLQLYWLRVAFPEVDWDVKPLDWAVRALAAGFEHGRAFEMVQTELLYRRELCRDAGLSKLADTLRHPDAVVRLYELRWRAALGYEQWALVFDELPKVRRRLFDQPALLANLLTWLLGWMAWSPEEHVRRHFRESHAELEALASGNRNFDYLMERIDFLVELADQWRSMSPMGFLLPEIHELIPISWRGTASQIRWRVFAIFQSILKDVRRAMPPIERLAVSQSSPLVFAQLVSTAQQTYFASRNFTRPDAERVQSAFRDFRRRLGERATRLDLLDFLFAEGLSVDDLLNVVGFRETTAAEQDLLATIGSDGVVRLVNLAQLTAAG